MNWIPARPTLLRAELFGGFVAVAQVFMQHLRSINAQSRTRIEYTSSRQKPLELYISAIFSDRH